MYYNVIHKLDLIYWLYIVYHMKDYRKYEAKIDNTEGDSETFCCASYIELEYNLIGFLEESEEDYFFLKIEAISDDGDRNVLCNLDENYGPIAKGSLFKIIDSIRRASHSVKDAMFDAAVTKCGNSMVLKITEYCRIMGLGVGDIVRVKMERINTIDSRDNITKLFYRKDTTAVDFDGIYVDEPEYLEKFLKDYRVKGQVSLEDIDFDLFEWAIDHEFAVRTEDGNVILVSMPYNNEGKECNAKAFADANNLNYDYLNEYSCYHRGSTKFIIFWLKGVVLSKSN